MSRACSAGRCSGAASPNSTATARSWAASWRWASSRWPASPASPSGTSRPTRTVATAAALTGWWAGGGYGEPYYYDYGSGGNCYSDEQAVYVDDQAVATPEEYAQQAADIAATGADQLASPIAMDANEEWLPLGVFGLSTSKEEKQPTKYFQLAVNKDGVINGTYVNTATNRNLPIQGAVDKKTQRASWFVGDKKDTVMETGVYNLTKDQTSVLVHFGTERTEEYLLVRMDPPPEAAQPAAAPAK